MKQTTNTSFTKFVPKKVVYVFSYHLYKQHQEVSVPGSEKMSEELARRLDGMSVKLAKSTVQSAFIKGVMVPPQWCYPVKYSYERRCEEYARQQRWCRTSHSGRQVIIVG